MYFNKKVYRIVQLCILIVKKYIELSKCVFYNMIVQMCILVKSIQFNDVNSVYEWYGW